MTALLLSADLMVCSRVAGAAARCGAQVISVPTVESLFQRLTADRPALVVLDLGLPGLDPSQIVPKLKALTPAPRVMAFGPHVQKARLEAAAAAGCDTVLTRGQFHAQLDSLLSQPIA